MVTHPTQITGIFAAIRHSLTSKRRVFQQKQFGCAYCNFEHDDSVTMARHIRTEHKGEIVRYVRRRAA